MTVGLRFESVKNRLKPCLAGRARGVDFLVEQCRPGKREPITGSSWIASILGNLKNGEYISPSTIRDGRLSSKTRQVFFDHIFGLICTLVRSTVLWVKGVKDIENWSSLCHTLPTNLPCAGYWNSYFWVDDGHWPKRQLADHPICLTIKPKHWRPCLMSCIGDRELNKHLSNEKNLGCLGDIGDYTT